MDGPDPNSSALRWFEPPTYPNGAVTGDPWTRLAHVADDGTWGDVEAAWSRTVYDGDLQVRLAARLRLARSTSYLTGEPPIGAADGDEWRIGSAVVTEPARRSLRFAAEAALEQIADNDASSAATDTIALSTLGLTDSDRRAVSAAVQEIRSELAGGGAHIALIDGDLDHVSRPVVARWAPHQLWRLRTSDVTPTRIAVVVPAALVDIGSNAGTLHRDDTVATLDLAAALWQPWQAGPLGTARGALDAARAVATIAA